MEGCATVYDMHFIGVLKVELFRTPGLKYMFGEWIGQQTKKGSLGKLWYNLINLRHFCKILTRKT